jgi:hypothetical protein
MSLCRNLAAKYLFSSFCTRWSHDGARQVYDHIVNPGHWTEDMREAALVPARLDPSHKVHCARVGMNGSKGIARDFQNPTVAMAAT